APEQRPCHGLRFELRSRGTSFAKIVMAPVAYSLSHAGGIMLKGKTALVTGSTSGIGLALATALAREGANIVVHGFGEPATIAAAENQLQALRVKALSQRADMSKPAQIEQMIRTAESQFGRIDILVNN